MEIIREYGDASGSTLEYRDGSGEHTFTVLPLDNGEFAYDLDGQRILWYNIPDRLTPFAIRAESSYRES